MASEHMRLLDAEFPSLGMFVRGTSGASVGQGWVALLRPVLEVLAKHHCVLTQIKAKFCALVVYFGYPDEGISDAARGEIATVYQNARLLSLVTCERCGSQENVRDAGKATNGTRLCVSCSSVSS